MSWADDARKLLQDFVAPELRAISARMDFSDKLATERHVALMEKLESTYLELTLKIDLASANRKIEELQSRQQGTIPQ